MPTSPLSLPFINKRGAAFTRGAMKSQATCISSARKKVKVEIKEHQAAHQINQLPVIPALLSDISVSESPLNLLLDLLY